MSEVSVPTQEGRPAAMGDVSDGRRQGDKLLLVMAVSRGRGTILSLISRACSGPSRSKYTGTNTTVDPLQTITVEKSKNWPSKISPKTLNFNDFKLEQGRGTG